MEHELKSFLCEKDAARITEMSPKARDVSETVHAGTLLERLKALNNETLTILREARASGGTQDNGLALRAIARMERQLAFEARLLGERDDSVKLAVGVQIAEKPAPPTKPMLANLRPEQLERLKELALAAEATGVRVSLSDLST
jgi:hypothetical protein